MLDDPYSMVYAHIVAVLKRQDLKVVSFLDNRLGAKDTLAEADLPEIQVRPTNLSGQLGDTSSTSAIVRSYQILINTGENRLKDYLFPVEWKITCAMFELKYGDLNMLRYKEVPFILTTEITAATAGISDPTQNRGATGWSSVGHSSDYVI